MLVEDMVSLCRELGLQKIKVRGDNVTFCCPYHNENNPSCGISASKEVGGCFACGEHFNLTQLVAHQLNMNTSSALEFLTEKFNTDFRSVKSTHKMKLYGESNDESVNLPMTALAPYNSGEIVHPYLLRRGFSEDDFVKFKLGWDRVKKRITIPFFDEKGKLLGFSGRAVKNELDADYGLVYGSEAKYFIYNHFNAKDYFYPLNLFKPNDTLILVEGLLDAVWMYKFGYENTLSLVSAEASKTQLNKLKLLGVKQIILCLDNDSAGENGCKRLYNKLKNYFTFKRVLFPVNKKDVQECTKEELKNMLSNAENYPQRNFNNYVD